MFRALTYLSPSLPLELFELVTAHLGRALGGALQLETEERSSGPMHGDVDPFTEGRADLGFLCSPSYLYLVAQPEPSVALVPAGFVFEDPRAAGAPVYFSDVVVRTEHPADAFADLAGTAWGYNDACSLSGYFATAQKLSQLGCNGTFFSERVQTGSHLTSLEAILAGRIDSAAIDSTVLALALRERPDLATRLRVVDSFGPFPIQPVVVRRELAPAWKARLAAALLTFGDTPGGAEARARFGLVRCVPITDAAYAEERAALRALGQLP